MTELQAEKTKVFFASKTVWWNLAGIIFMQLVAWIWPGISKAVCDKHEVFVMASMLLFTLFCTVNLWLRKITNCKIGSALVLALLLSGCSGIPQKLDTEIYYRRDLPFCVAGYACYEGMTVLPKRDVYEFEVAPKGDADIDLMVVTTCHRNTTYEKTDAGWFIFKNKSRFKYIYTPNPLIEGDGDCPLVFQTFEKEKGRHAWAVILFEHHKYTLPATLFCDGLTIQSAGVSGCQSKEGLTQGIQFSERVMIEANAGCPMPKRGNAKFYEWPMGYKQCGYTFRGESGQLGTLFTSGYRGELIRETK